MAADGPVVHTELRGGDRLARTLLEASRDLSRLDRAAAEAGRVVVAEARAKAPRRTGALASTGAVVKQSNGVGVTFTAVYAPPIHWGWRAHGIAMNPWLSLAAQRTEPRWFNAYVDETEQHLKKVHGA